MRIPDPAQFAWNRFGRHLTTSHSSRPATDLNAALKRTYPHRSTDRDRLLAHLKMIQSGIIKDTIADWAKKAARYEAGRRLLDDRDDRDLLGPVVVEALQGKCTAGKTKPAMPPLRLTRSMMTVIREDTDSQLVASIAPEGEPGINLMPCGGGNYARCWADLIESPPEGVFAIIEFDKAPATTADVILNVSPRNIRVSGGVISRDRISAAKTLIGDADWSIITTLAGLANRRLTNNRAIPAIDAKIDQIGGLLKHDVDDLIDVLPASGSLEWRVLRRIVLNARDAAEDEAPPNEENEK